MTISKEPIRCKLSINNKTIEEVIIFNYLGAITSSGRNLPEEMGIYANKAAIIPDVMCDMEQQVHINKNKERIYRMTVRQVLTYVAETRASMNEKSTEDHRKEN